MKNPEKNECCECEVKDKLIANMDALIKRQEKALDKAVEINENILSLCQTPKPEGKCEPEIGECLYCGNSVTIGKCVCKTCHQAKPESLGCAHGRGAGVPCPWCLGINTPEVSPEKKKEKVVHCKSCNAPTLAQLENPKKEKEKCTCYGAGGHYITCPTLTEQKGEWRELEKMAGLIHFIYQNEAKRQGDVRHADKYEDLPENIKEYDRVLAHWFLTELAQKEQAVKAEIRKEFDRKFSLCPLDKTCRNKSFCEVANQTIETIRQSLLSDKVNH